jgi:NAD(P)-dependent dehydrogenase (short-subunit alcohol dehydrogenase family)
VLAGRTALVTGGGRRIGRAVSLALASCGAAVIVHYGRSAAAAVSLVDEIARQGGSAFALGADLEDPHQAEALISHAREKVARVDILVNNASIFRAEELGGVTLESLLQNVTVNAWAPFVLTRAFARQAERGSVVNLLDTRITGLDLAHPSYILSKHLLAAMTRMTAVAFAPAITVNAVAPGLILPPEGKDDGYLARLARELPLQRHGEPQDVARAVVFLVASGFVTGQVIFVDGGQHLLVDGSRSSV